MFDHLERAEEVYKNTIYAAQIEGEERGIKLGEERGERLKAAVIARKMLNRGRPMEEIAEDTGLTVDEIKKLMQ